MIEELKKKIDQSLKNYLLRIKKEYRFHLVHPLLFESIKEFSLRKGKRIRPLLLILSYKAFSKKRKTYSPSLFNASVCMELLHNFMLIHDDIIDRSKLRRGKPTIHHILKKTVRTADKDKLGVDLGIVAGDIVYALAIDAFLAIDEDLKRKEKALRYFVKTAASTAMGEFIDILHGFQTVKSVKERDVFLNYTLKTAIYTFQCPLIIGAILAGAKQKEIDQLGEFGLKIGQAFQIQDDIIGIFGSQKMIGKSILSDLDESKKTLLVSHAFDKLPPKERKEFLRIFLKKKKSYKDLVSIRAIFIKSKSLDYCVSKINKLVRSSEEILRKLHIRDEYRLLTWQSLTPLFKNINHIASNYQTSIRIRPFR